QDIASRSDARAVKRRYATWTFPRANAGPEGPAYRQKVATRPTRHVSGIAVVLSLSRVNALAGFGAKLVAARRPGSSCPCPGPGRSRSAQSPDPGQATRDRPAQS